MRFTPSIYKRLYNIAFFMPDIRYKKNKVTSPSFPKRISIEDAQLKERIERCTSCLYDEREDFSCYGEELMHVDSFEKKLFLVCLKLYKALIPFFERELEYEQIKDFADEQLDDKEMKKQIKYHLNILLNINQEKNNKFRIKQLKEQLNDLEKGNHTKDLIHIAFRHLRGVLDYLSCTPLDAKTGEIKMAKRTAIACKYFTMLCQKELLSLDDLREATKNGFDSVRAACSFYFNFSRSYYLYLCSDSIRKCQDQISFLKFIKTDIFFLILLYHEKYLSSISDNAAECISSLNLYYETYEYSKKHKIDSSILDEIKEVILLDLLNLFPRPYVKEKNRNDFDCDCMDVGKKDTTTNQEQKKRGRPVSQKRQKILDKLLPELIDQLQSVPKKQRKRKYQKFFESHKKDFENAHIYKFSTLQRLVSGSDPNKQRDLLTADDYKYNCPDYSSIKDYIINLFDDFRIRNEQF